MENKVLVKLIVPEISEVFDVFLPVNEVVWKIKKMLVKCITDIDNVSFDSNKDFLLIKKENSKVYSNNELIINTDIRNATELVLISK